MRYRVGCGVCDFITVGFAVKFACEQRAAAGRQVRRLKGRLVWCGTSGYNGGVFLFAFPHDAFEFIEGVERITRRELETARPVGRAA